MIIEAGLMFICTATAVWDGDGPIWCAEGPKIRLAGIAARESDGTCRSNQPCPRATAEQARNRLVNLLGGSKGTRPEGHVIIARTRLTCRSEGSAGGSRTAAWCVAPRVGDLSCAMVNSGTVLPWPRYWRDHRCS
jgi:endonuclease YncB( thermonuclease family)